MSKKYRPSNGTEGTSFMAVFCDRCVREPGCPLIPLVMLYNVEDPEYPSEWTYTKDGRATCAAFYQGDPYTKKAAICPHVETRNQTHSENGKWVFSICNACDARIATQASEQLWLREET